ncbi:unnamed protein product, partial [Arabidopsis halleri]
RHTTNDLSLDYSNHYLCPIFDRFTKLSYYSIVIYFLDLAKLISSDSFLYHQSIYQFIHIHEFSRVLLKLRFRFGLSESIKFR